MLLWERIVRDSKMFCYYYMPLKELDRAKLLGVSTSLEIDVFIH